MIFRGLYFTSPIPLTVRFFKIFKTCLFLSLRGDSGWGEGGIGLEPPLDVGGFSVVLPLEVGKFSVVLPLDVGEFSVVLPTPLLDVGEFSVVLPPLDVGEFSVVLSPFCLPSKIFVSKKKFKIKKSNIRRSIFCYSVIKNFISTFFTPKEGLGIKYTISPNGVYPFWWI